MKCQTCMLEIKRVPYTDDHWVHIDIDAQIMGKWPIHRALPFWTVEEVRRMDDYDGEQRKQL